MRNPRLPVLGRPAERGRSNRGDGRWRPRAGRFLLYAVLVFVAALFLIPILWLALCSVKTNTEYNAYPIKVFPSKLRWQNYYAAIASGAGPTSPPRERYKGLIKYLGAFRRSLVLITISTVPGVLTSAMVGFGFARHRAPGRDALFKIMLAMMMVPGISTTMPLYVIYSYLGMVGTYWPWLLGAVGSNVFFTFMFRQFFASFPKELEDAAEIDGCGRWAAFWRIFLPNAGPVLATCAIFSFQGNWGDWFSPVLLLKSNQLTMATLLQVAYRDPMGHPRHVETMAAVMIFVLPCILVYLLGQRYIQQSVVTSGLK